MSAARIKMEVESLLSQVERRLRFDEPRLLILCEEFGWRWTSAHAKEFFGVLHRSASADVGAAEGAGRLSQGLLSRAHAHAIVLHDVLQEASTFAAGQTPWRKGLRNVVSGLLLAHQAPILVWLNRLLSFRSHPIDSETGQSHYAIHLGQVASLLLLAVALLPEEPMDQWNTPAYVRFVTEKIWRCEIPACLPSESKRDFNRFPLSCAPREVQEQGVNRILVIAVVMLSSSGQGSMLVETLSNNRKLATILVEGIRRRALALDKYKETLPPLFLLASVSGLTHLVNTLVHLSYDDLSIQGALVSKMRLIPFSLAMANVLSHVSTLDRAEICSAPTDSLSGPERAQRALMLLVEMLVGQQEDPGWPDRYDRRMPAAGCLLRVLQKLHTAIPLMKEKDKGRFGLLISQALHPTVALSLVTLSVKREAMLSYANDEDEPEAMNGAIWRGFWGHLRDYYTAYQVFKSIGLDICDNFSCRAILNEGVVSKKCTGCFTTAYCSSECQKSDWDHLHRSECSAASNTRNVSKFERLTFRLKDRAFHAKNCGAILSALRITDEQWYSNRDTIPSLTWVRGDPQISFDGGSLGSIKGRVPDAKFSLNCAGRGQGYLKPRIERQMQLGEELGSRTRVVHIGFSWFGRPYGSLVATVERQYSGVFKVLHSTAYYA